MLGDGQPAVGGPEDGDRSGHGGPPPWLLFPAGISLRVRVSVRVKDGRTRRDPLTSQTHTGQRFVFCPCCWAIDKVEAGTQGARCSRLVSATTVLGRGDVAVGTWPGTSGLEWCTHLQLRLIFRPEFNFTFQMPSTEGTRVSVFSFYYDISPCSLKTNKPTAPLPKFYA